MDINCTKDDQNMPGNDAITISKIQINKTRVQDQDGFPATIKYVGSVASAKNRNEKYIGVEWDDPTRGKHDGSVICRKTNTTVRHFHTEAGSNFTAGSFLRLSKVDFGNELNLDLMKDRYVGENADLVAPNNTFQDCYARTTKGFMKPIELYGEVKIRKKQQLQNLTEISLRSLGITRLEDEPSEELLRLGSRYLEVDLGSNLFSDWIEVKRVIQLFANVTNFSLASNRLQDIQEMYPSILSPGQFTNITILNLNHCCIKSFRTIMIVAESIPNVQELYLSSNDLSDINSYSNASKLRQSLVNKKLLQQVSLIDCSSCNLSSWNEQIMLLSSLPQLKTLILDHNFISSISLSNIKSKVTNETANDSARNEIGAPFSKLSTLQIASNTIDSWGSIDALSHKNFPSLHSLRFRNNPLTENIATGEARAIIIARIGGKKLSYLNASVVSERERLESERRYVRNVARELLLFSSDNVNKKLSNENEISQAEQTEINEKKKEFFLNHPQFHDLAKIHGEFMGNLNACKTNSPWNQNNGKPYGSIGHTSVQVVIRSMAPSSCTKEPIRKRVPLSLTVQRLKNICHRAFLLSMELQKLSLKNNPTDPFPTIMDDDESTLAYWGVVENAEIWMEEVEPEEYQQRKGKENVEHQEKMLEQERSGDCKNGEMKRERLEYLVAAREAATNVVLAHKK